MILYEFDTLDSTNSEALRRLPELPGTSVLWAHEQTAGRGQRGNSWLSAPGENLTFSYVLKQDIPAREAHFLNYAISEAVAVFMLKHGVNACVKWPNDIYVGKNKICGILIENTLVGEFVAASVIGVGVNINQKEFPQLVNATSMYRCTGELYELKDCLEEIVCLFRENLVFLGDPAKRALLFAAYSSHLFQKGSSAQYRDMASGEEFTGTILGVEPADGRLCIRDASGKDRLYRFKEVSYIL